MRWWREADSSMLRMQDQRGEIKPSFRETNEETDTGLILHACAVHACSWSVDDRWDSQEAEILFSTWVILATYTACEGHPTQLPCTDRLCDTTSAFSRHGKVSYRKIFQKHPFLVSGVGHDGELPTVEDLCVTYVTHRNSQPPTMPDCSCLVRPRRVWRCFLQLDMPLTFMEYVLSTRQRCCCKQTKNIYMFHP